MNLSKSIYIGDHVWIGQHAMILKGTNIGSGSIIGAMSVVSGKRIPSNESWAGNPVKQIATNVFYSSKCVHKYQDEETKESLVYDTDDYIYQNIKSEIRPFNQIEEKMATIKKVEEKLIWLKNNVSDYQQKNRFYIKK